MLSGVAAAPSRPEETPGVTEAPRCSLEHPPGPGPQAQAAQQHGEGNARTSQDPAVAPAGQSRAWGTGSPLLPRDREGLGAVSLSWHMEPRVGHSSTSAPNLTPKPCWECLHNHRQEECAGSSPCLWNSHRSSTEFQASSFVSAPQVRSFTASATVRCSSAAQFTVSEQFKTLTTSPKQSVWKSLFFLS